jgi:hypothetical protein
LVGQERRPLGVDFLCRHTGGDFTGDDLSVFDKLDPTPGAWRLTDGRLRLNVGKPDLIDTGGKRFAVRDRRVDQTHAAERLSRSDATAESNDERSDE